VWRLACIGSGLCTVVNAASGPTQTTPTLVDVTLGPPTMLIVEPQPGQLAADIRNLAHRLAGTLGAVAPSVESHGPLAFRRFVDHVPAAAQAARTAQVLPASGCGARQQVRWLARRSTPWSSRR